VRGAINMLGLAKRVRARILQASTSEVYGQQLGWEPSVPLAEGLRPTIDYFTRFVP